MVALEHQGPSRRGFLARDAGWGRAIHFYMFVEYLSVQFDLDELRFFSACACAIETGSTEVDDIFIPRAGFGLSIGPWWCRSINCSHVSPVQVLFSETVKHLYFVFAHHIDAGIGALRNHDFKFDANVGEFFQRVDVNAPALSID